MRAMDTAETEGVCWCVVSLVSGVIVGGPAAYLVPVAHDVTTYGVTETVMWKRKCSFAQGAHGDLIDP